MVKTVQKIALPLLLTFITASAAAAVDGCDLKRAAIQKEIDYAKAYNNPRKVAGLEKALQEVNTYCTHDGLVKEAQEEIRELERDIREKQADIREIESELNQAKTRGDRDKIEKYQEKIADEQDDIRELEQELEEAKAELSTLNG